MENESDKIGLLILGVRGLTSPENPWVRLVKKESFLFNWREVVSLLKNTPLTKVAQTLNQRMDGLPAYVIHEVMSVSAEELNSMIRQIKSNAKGFGTRVSGIGFGKSLFALHCRILS